MKDYSKLIFCICLFTPLLVLASFQASQAQNRRASVVFEIFSESNSEGIEKVIQHLGIPKLVLENQGELTPEKGQWEFCYAPEQKRKISELKDPIVSIEEAQAFATQLLKRNSFRSLETLSLLEKATLQSGERYSVKKSGVVKSATFEAFYFRPEDQEKHNLTPKRIRMVKEGNLKL